MPTKQDARGAKNMTFVIGIGASAGGLEAINDFFRNTPVNTYFSFIVIQHLSPDHKSLMSELLSKHTDMEVVEAEDGMKIKPNHVYLLPNKKFMTIRNGNLELQNKVKTGLPNNAIDIFFHSLAEDYKTSAVGIILSGTGTDGSKGLEAIKQNGGIAIVQDPLTAAFDGMPNSAIDAGVPDLILSPDQMVSELQTFIDESNELKAFHLDVYKNESFMRDLLLTIQKSTGSDFSYYKRPTLFRRLSKRMMELNIPNIKDYLEYLEYHAEEVQTISQEFLINVTYFFRDKEAFDIIEQKVLPKIMQDKKPGDTVKFWSAACSSGEEAYSLAILLDEYLNENLIQDLRIKIFATDIDRPSLEKASRGVYPKEALNELSRSRVEKYFVQEGNFYRISPELRKLIVFSFHDLLKDPPFSRMDLVLCRNMLIYVNAHAQQEIIRKLHFSLNIGGFMFLGPSEYAGKHNTTIEEIDKKWRIYRTLAKTSLNNRDSLYLPTDRKIGGIDYPQQKIKNPLNHISDLFKETLLEDYEFAGILIDLNMEVRQTTGNYKSYIDFPDTGLQFNLIKLVPNEMGISLNIAIRKAIKNNETVSLRKVKIKYGKSTRIINITVKPYLQQKEYQEGFLFIVLRDDHEDTPPAFTPKLGQEDSEAYQKIESLEKELRETRENLQAVIEEIEAANEELQSTNEEMVSTNEELQSTNEELQSLNEELHTVSAEHQAKIREMMELNDDLNNYFNNSEIGQILIDRNLTIRKFSPSVTRMVNLIPMDINRSIMDITVRFKYIDFVGNIRQVMIDQEPIEKEIVIDNCIYLLRILPYVRQDKTQDGVVVNFVDITDLKKLNNVLEAVLNSSPSGICALRAIRNEAGEPVDFEFMTANERVASDLKTGTLELINQRLSQFPKFFKHYFDSFSKVFKSGESMVSELVQDDHTWHEIRIIRLLDGIVMTDTDITEKKQAADLINQSFNELKETSSQLQASNLQLEQTNMDLMQFASVASHDLKEPLRKIQAFGNILMAKTKDKLDQDELRHLDKIVSSSFRMQKLIEDVLTLSKLSNRSQVFEIVDLNEVLNRILDDMEITIRETHAEIKVEQLPVIQGISGQMHQVFQNLISNSIKFSGGSHPLITISETNVSKQYARKLDINPDDYVCISLRDQGIGFEDIYKDKIFGIFQRLHGNNFDGTGIGLAICRKIIDNHHGFILAESELNKGSEFFIILPKKQVSGS